MCPIEERCRRQAKCFLRSQRPDVADPVQEDRRSDETKTDHTKLVHGNHASGLQILYF